MNGNKFLPKWGMKNEIRKNVFELIGNTPLVEITSYPLPEGVRLFAKLEYLNPGGSVKDRLGQYLLKRAFQEGKLKKVGPLLNRLLETLELVSLSQLFNLVYKQYLSYLRNSV